MCEVCGREEPEKRAEVPSPEFEIWSSGFLLPGRKLGGDKGRYIVTLIQKVGNNMWLNYLGTK